ncbi:MAG: hypothetical protein JOZ54_08275 [Acidobacteria bacterium]|nr:hypothetical protein [Acidobacteriota bacterium]
MRWTDPSPPLFDRGCGWGCGWGCGCGCGCGRGWGWGGGEYERGCGGGAERGCAEEPELLPPEREPRSTEPPDERPEPDELLPPSFG